MSRRHAWLRFTADGPHLPLDAGSDAVEWQRRLGALHARWYDGQAPPAVAAVFVLQWILQVPAHTAAHAAACGPWRARLDDLSFSLGGGLVPAVVRMSGVSADDRGMAARLDAAETDYRAVAGPLASRYTAQVRLGPRVRSALVDDMWAAARREAEAAAGLVRPAALPRASCCLIYALPGCVECAGCPRLRPSPTTG